MAKPNKDKFKKVFNDLDKYPSVQSVADAFGVSTRAIFTWSSTYKHEGAKLIDRSPGANARPRDSKTPDKILREAKLEKEIVLLKKDLKEIQKKALTSQKLMSVIHEVSGASFKRTPGWLTSNTRKKVMTGIPTLFLSDIHYDEFVDPAQINYVNDYNREIADRRIKHVFKNGITILNNYIAKPNYDGIIIALGGDMLSGNIHDELARTNEAPILRSVIDLTQLLIDGISTYADVFGKVHVPCVVGNHGRLHKKPVAKNRVFDNYEWLIYQYIAKHFRNDKRVTVQIPDAPDAIFKVYDRTFLLTHGDQFRGGSGISGIMTPLHMGLHKKHKKHAAIHNPFDVMILGHFHQYIHTNSMVVNGSIKGYDEWVNLMNFPFEPPQQALWINHPKAGMVMRTPILCDDLDDKEMGAFSQEVFT